MECRALCKDWKKSSFGVLLSSTRRRWKFEFLFLSSMKNKIEKQKNIALETNEATGNGKVDKGLME